MPTLYKTDWRFSMRKFGFTCYLDFDNNSYRDYQLFVRQCRQMFGEQFWRYGEYSNSSKYCWCTARMQGPHRRTRIYLKDESQYTMLLLGLDHSNA